MDIIINEYEMTEHEIEIVLHMPGVMVLVGWQVPVFPPYLLRWAAVWCI